MELFWYIVVILFIFVKIFVYICWYRSRQRQLAAFIGNPRNAQVVIMGARAYGQQVCERQNNSRQPSWRSGVNPGPAREPSAPRPPTSPYSQLDAPPPYQDIYRMGELKPPPYSECAQGGANGGPWTNPDTMTLNHQRITDAPPPYKAHPDLEPGLPQRPPAGEGPPGAGQ